MYVVVKNNSKKTSKFIQIVHSFRDLDGKTRKKIIKHLGTAKNNDQVEIDKLVTKARKLIKLLIDADPKEYDLILGKNIIDNKNISVKPLNFKKYGVSTHDKISSAFLTEEKSVITGIHDIYGYLFDKLKFDQILGDFNFKNQANAIIKNLVLTRIANPASKRNSVKFLEDKFNINIKLDQVYRTMDFIDDKVIDNIKKTALNAAKSIYQNINIAFYDVTTLYFESFSEDDFKANGYSKDFKFNQPQVLFALLTTDCGIPLSYEVFPGNTFEGNTLIKAVSKLKTDYGFKNITVVADRGMINKKNLEYLEKNDFKYIIGAKLRSMENTLKEKILNRNDYIVNNLNTYEYKEICIENKKLIITYRKERAYKDFTDRQKAIDDLIKKLGTNKKASKLISNYGYKKYIDISKEQEIGINEEKIAQDAKWDGLHGVITNTNFEVDQVISKYRDLWQIEESFRINKHDLSIRPIFHWTQKRIKSHIAITFISYTCIRHMMYICQCNGMKLSTNIITENLLSVGGTIMNDNNKRTKYFLPSKINSVSSNLYEYLGLTPIKKIKKLI